jgi:hypothetical protein
MFEKIAKKPSKKVKKSVSLEKTTTFLQAVVDAGCRLSYGAFAGAAKALKEDSSTQIAAQRGAKLVKSLPEALQPFVCRKAGNYAKGISWAVDVPADLEDRPVIITESLASALKEWKASLS